MRWPLVVYLAAVIGGLSSSGCVDSGGDTVIDIVFDPCEPLDIVPAADAFADEVESVRDAAAMWNAVADTRLAVESTPSSSPHVPVRFERAAALFHGVYQDEVGVIVINRTLEDRHARAITIAHELGHAFGLWHERERSSVMNSGNLELAPNDDDARALAALWGDCALR